MKEEGILRKLGSSLQDTVAYSIAINGRDIGLNELLGNTLGVTFMNEIFCLHCGKKIAKSFAQGYCYPCFTSIPETDPSVINPELNRAHEGISRDMQWSERHDLIDHFVYLSVTSDVKVGVTRHTQIPTRWIDQGATHGIKIARTPYRQLAGIIEVALKQYLNDKTNWRKMLTSEVTDVPDLVQLKELYISYLPDDLQQFIEDDDTITIIKYPVTIYPNSVRSISLDKTAGFSGVLTGIKGQYLIFEDGSVLNIRKHGGYKVRLEF